MADNLKPCPFCGAEAVVDGKSDDLRIRCEGCDTKGPSFYFDSDDQNDIDTAERDAIEQWNRRAAPPVGDDGLPPLPEPFANFDPRYEGGDCPVFTADQYRQGQREAIAAKARDYELLELIAEQMKVRLAAADERIEELEAGRRAAVPAQTGTQQPAGDSVDTPEFADLLSAWGNALPGEPALNAAETLIAHIDAWATRRAAVSTASAPDGWKLVPIKPTPKMIDATFNDPQERHGTESHNSRNKRIYAAMLAASSSSPVE